ncbi:MAG: 23S rRNA (pseudouridine(1915)-N(3))-methyltransferase RlmH [Acholeplasmatales bacterium]|nr:23S rRNA (pseudouridine(1915)-N(3))-methyltransferase RlmH [Acholeplasmatales bacterium]
MKITVVGVGSIKESYFKDAIAEYSKRLSKYCSVEIIEVKDEMIKENSSAKDDEIVKKIEGERIIKALPKNSCNVLLDLRGKKLDSVGFSKMIDDIMKYENSNITFIIGGSIGVSKEVYDLADYKLCFSDMTFPHKLMRVILLEQVYRAFKILKNETYHK